MLLLYVTFGCVFIGSSTGIKYESECYGTKFRLPFEYSPPLFFGRLYFTPSNRGTKKLLLEDRQVKDPRLDTSYGSATFLDPTERNGGTFSVSIGDSRDFEVIKLKVLDCAEKISKYYGRSFQKWLSGMVDYVEFTPIRDLDRPVVLWNRTNPQTHDGGRGRLKSKLWEMTDLTQADNGYYNFWAQGTLLSGIHLTVTEQFDHYETSVNEYFLIENPFGSTSWTVTHTRNGETEEDTLLRNGKKVTENWRVKLKYNGVYIGPVVVEDAGRYDFRDADGNLAKSVNVEVYQEPDSPTVLYIVLIVVGVVIGLIICCCCVKKCCCKKSSSKRNESTPQPAAAPAVYHHDGNQHAGYSGPSPPVYSYQPMNSPAVREPAAASLGPSPAAPAGPADDPAPSFSSNNLSSDPDPTFELKGLNFPSASPLSSDSATCDVYTSDKLNFL